MRAIGLILTAALLALVGCSRAAGPVPPATVSEETAAEQKSGEMGILDEEKAHSKHPYSTQFPELESQQRHAEKMVFQEERAHSTQMPARR